MLDRGQKSIAVANSAIEFPGGLAPEDPLKGREENASFSSLFLLFLFPGFKAKVPLQIVAKGSVRHPLLAHLRQWFHSKD